MKDMRAVFMDVDALDIFCKNISANLSAFFYHKATFTFFMKFVSAHTAKQPRAHYQIIIPLHITTNR
jgi:hypothetical protein